jgi:hypothetical protein
MSDRTKPGDRSPAGAGPVVGAIGLSDFDRGVHDALTWHLGGGPGPVSGAMAGLPVPAPAVMEELAAAEAVLTKSRGGYAAGIVHALTSAHPRAGRIVEAGRF